MKVLVLNCGGSSIKYRLYEMPGGETLAGGNLERVGLPHSILTHRAGGTESREQLHCPTHADGIQRILRRLTESPGAALAALGEIEAVGHRVVHGGDYFDGPALVNRETIAGIEQCAPLAPLHNPHHLAGIHACREALPGVPMATVFDNVFHRTIPDYARAYAIPRDLARRHSIRRYGFHGIAFQYATERTARLLGRPLDGMKLITLMLGSGCTANAVKDGRSLEVSTGLTPLEGLMQSTRSGDLDPTVVTYLQEKEGLSPAAVNDLLNRKSGWLGLSGVSADLREVQQAAAAGNEAAQLTLRAFVHRARKYVGAYAAVLGGVDALIFTGGVGEHSPEIRAAICEGLEFLGLKLDPQRNAAASSDALIAAPDSRASISVVAMDEESVIAAETYRLARGASSRHEG